MQQPETTETRAELPNEKFSHPIWTAKGERRGQVAFTGLSTLWFNTGTLCNIACAGCYIESSPKNDSLVYLTRLDVQSYLKEASSIGMSPPEIGFTGGEPFMNPDFLGMLEDVLVAGHRTLVLTNAMRPLQRHKTALLALQRRFAGKLSIRVSLDHYERHLHENVRGPRSWQPAVDGLKWLAANGFDLAIAGRQMWHETEREMRDGYARTMAALGIKLDAFDPARLVLFPEMDPNAEVPEISEGCWKILGKRPDDMMCASSRMVVRHKGAKSATIVACTLLPHAPEFDLGPSLAAASRTVHLNHRHCAKFCVLGGASCSVAKE